MTEQPTPPHKPGDVVNGYVLTEAGQWVPHVPTPGAVPPAPPPGHTPGAASPVPPVKRPFWRRWWVIALAALVVIVVIVNLGGGGDEDDADAAPQATETAAAQSPEPTETTPEAPPTEEPEPTQEPISIADQIADTYGTFEPVQQSGAGDSIIALPAGGAVGMVTATHDGSSNFAIIALDANNESTGDLLVNTIGAYSGTAAYGLSAFGDATSLQISADGNWTLTIAPLAAAPVLGLPTTGAGDGVLLYDGPAGAWSITHEGESNFAVIQYDDNVFPNLLVNEIGAYSGTVPVRSGPAVLVINGDGSWSVTPQ